MRNGNKLPPIAILINHRINTTPNRLRLRNLGQFTPRTSMVRSERARHVRVPIPALVGAVECSCVAVEGQPARHAAAYFLGVAETEFRAGEVEGVEVPVVVGCPEAAGFGAWRWGGGWGEGGCLGEEGEG